MTTYLDPVTGESFPLDTPLWRSPSGNPLMLSPLPASGVATSTRVCDRFGDIGLRCRWRSRRR